jgi:uncharacterized OB-fold protein
MPDIGILPVPDRDSVPYWAALANGTVELQQCDSCGHWTWPPRPICSNCQSDQLSWRPIAGTGSVYSWVITHKAYVPAMTDLVPFTIAVVRIDEQDDVLIPGIVVDAGEVEMRQGLRVRAVTEQLADGIGTLCWTP